MDGIFMINWLELRKAGLYCIPGDFYVDPKIAVTRAVVSHAHADHYPRYCQEVHATPETLAIGLVRYQNTAARLPCPHICGEPFVIGPVSLTFLHAGHILGSAQVLISYAGQTALYTGDISFDDNPTCMAIEMPTVPIDLLICESTFGEKESHPTPAAALAATLEAAGKRHIIIGTYVLGKAQRINRILNDLRPNMQVFVDRTITPIHNTYRQLGVDPGRHSIYRRQDTKRVQGQFVWLLPPQKMTGFHKDKEFYKVFASGWNKSEKAAWLNGQLEISDHASQTELQRYVNTIQPKTVRFWHGYPESLIRDCLAAGIDAAELLQVEG
jgi:putative mRNA 3-end processing factor